MADRVVLHVGLQKSGTTYLQFALAHHREALARAGVQYLVPSARHLDVPNHQTAVYGLLPDEFPWLSPLARANAAVDWRWLEERLAPLPGTVVISAEALSVVRESAVPNVLATLAPDGDASVLITMRPLDRMLTSAWQQSVRAGRTAGLVTMLRSVSDDRERVLALPHESADDRLDSVWRAYSVARLARRWGRYVGPGNVTVVTSPGRPPELLWERFLSCLGLSAEQVGALPPPQLSAGQRHVGLRLPEAELLVGMGSELSQLDAGLRAQVRLAVVEGFLSRPERGTRVTFPEPWGHRAAEWSREELDALRALGTRVVGDLDEVVAGRDEVSDLHSDPAELVTSGAAAVAATARLWLAEREARLAAEAAYEHVLPLWRRAIRGVRRKIRRQRRSRRLRAIGQ